VSFNLFDLFTQRKDASYVYDLDLIGGEQTDIYLRQYAINACANFLARTVSQSEFKTANKDVYYKLNVRPNPNQTATSFWQELVFKLITDNEVLVIQDDTQDLLIADSYTHNVKAVFPDTFSGVLVNDYQFQRSFSMDDVWFLQYNNDQLANYTNQLLSDYAKLFGRMVSFAMRNKQLRGIVDFSGATDLGSQAPKDKADGTKQESPAQRFINKLFHSFRDNDIAIVPLQKGVTYDEVSGKYSGADQSFDNIKALRDEAVDSVAEIIGIPPALMHGAQAEVDQNKQAFLDYCIAPLNQKIEDELNAKIINQANYQNDKIKVWGLNRPDPFKQAEAIDKITAVGTLSRNEVRGHFGYDPVAGGDEYYMTKNYQKITDNPQPESEDLNAKTINERRQAQGLKPLAGGDAIWLSNQQTPAIPTGLAPKGGDNDDEGNSN
jgi:HK97 family phage portal protein